MQISTIGRPEWVILRNFAHESISYPIFTLKKITLRLWLLVGRAKLISLDKITKAEYWNRSFRIQFFYYWFFWNWTSALFYSEIFSTKTYLEVNTEAFAALDFTDKLIARLSVFGFGLRSGNPLTPPMLGWLQVLGEEGFWRWRFGVA